MSHHHNVHHIKGTSQRTKLPLYAFILLHTMIPIQLKSYCERLLGVRNIFNFQIRQLDKN